MNPQPDTITGSFSREQTFAAAPRSSSAKRRANLLVADDNPALSGVLKFNFERAGFRVIAAGTGRVALEHALKEQFDLVVTDQQMPEMTGVELVRRLRELENYRAIPIFMLTAKGLELELPRLQSELGIAGMFLKPFSPKEVTRAIEQALIALADG